MSRLETPYEEIEEFQLYHKDTPPFVARMLSSNGETIISSENKEKEPIKLQLEIANTEVQIFQGCTYHDKFSGKKGLLYHIEYCSTKLTWRAHDYDTDLLLFDEMGKCISLISNSNSAPNKNTTIFWQCNFAIEVNAGLIKRNKITTDYYLDITPFCEWGDRTHPFELDYMKPLIVNVNESNK